VAETRAAAARSVLGRLQDEEINDDEQVLGRLQLQEEKGINDGDDDNSDYEPCTYDDFEQEDLDHLHEDDEINDDDDETNDDDDDDDDDDDNEARLRWLNRRCQC
jgi:RNA polymerase primary sigma factor